MCWHMYLPMAGSTVSGFPDNLEAFGLQKRVVWLLRGLRRVSKERESNRYLQSKFVSLQDITSVCNMSKRKYSGEEIHIKSFNNGRRRWAGYLMRKSRLSCNPRCSSWSDEQRTIWWSTAIQAIPSTTRNPFRPSRRVLWTSGVMVVTMGQGESRGDLWIYMSSLYLQTSSGMEPMHFALRPIKHPDDPKRMCLQVDFRMAIDFVCPASGPRQRIAVPLFLAISRPATSPS
ncbi:hypothetical protein CONLIGDRAFT_58632 [Coniochaeta ligniaria NRRL 30616]|uniref:Uncharacterized protein n=1 Tax=Coniochaeta ligniaria NRRL 30616 TaxID=1408157 RepID=A0A1J7J5N3_9PEZI|nr:hypothetical protein CONLIGDRAFT_58632 [Coniochaeta ligniaria NRRL 30616]